MTHAANLKTLAKHNYKKGCSRMNTRPVRWYHKLFYKWSRHGDVERGKHWAYATGHTVGYKKGYADALAHGPWYYPCDGPNTDPALTPVTPATITPAALQTLPPGVWSRTVLHAPGNSLHSQVLNAIHLQSHPPKEPPHG